MTIEQALSPKQAADLLGVGPNALKKYALLLEQNGYSVTRNEKNHRVYSPGDLDIIRAMLILNRIKGVQLDDAASKVTASDVNISLILSYDDTYTAVHTTVPNVTESHIPAIPQHVTDFITALQSELKARDVLHTEFMTAIEDKLSEQTTMIQQLSEQNESLLARLEEMELRQGSDNRKSLWAKLFGK